MTVRTHVPFGIRIVVGCLTIAAAVAAGAALSRWSRAPAASVDLQPRVAALTDENRALRTERDRLVEASNTLDSRGLMERSTIAELGNQVAALQTENTRLKEDVAFFEAATADRAPGGAVDTASGIAIRRFQATRDNAGHVVRYRILLTQDPKAPREFSGVLQLVVTLQQEGRITALTFPGAPAKEGGVNVSRYDVVFKSYKRIDGSVELPPAAVVRTVQARILERGVVRVQQTVTVN